MSKNSMGRLSQEASQLLLKVAAVRRLDHDARMLLFYEWRRFFTENQIKPKDQAGLMKHILAGNQEHRVEREGRMDRIRENKRRREITRLLEVADVVR